MVRSAVGRRWAALCLAGLAFVQVAPVGAFIGVAHAATEPVVAVVPLTPLDEVSKEAAGRITESLIAELSGKRGGVRLLGGGAAQDAAPTAPSPEVKRLFEEGSARLGDLDFDGAARSLREGIQKSLATVEHTDFARLFEAHVNLAVAHFRKGEEKEAQDALYTVARLAPEYELAEGKFPPIFVREFQKARKRADAAGKGSVEIEGPRGATAFVNGRDLGMVPLREDGLRVGANFVQVVGADGQRFGQRIEVNLGAVSKVKASFEAPAGPAPRLSMTVPDILDAAAAERLGALAKQSGADALVVGVVASGGEGFLVGAAVYSRRDRALRRFEPAKLDGKLEQLAGAVYVLGGQVREAVLRPALPDRLPVRLLPGARPLVAGSDTPTRAGGEQVVVRPGAGDLRRLDRPSVLDGEPEDPAGDVSRTAEVSGGVPWWVWVAGGIGAAAIAGGTVYGLSQAGRPVTGTVAARW